MSKDFPTSSANLGPGFDSIGIAVDRYLRVTARPAERWQVVLRPTLWLACQMRPT